MKKNYSHAKNSSNNISRGINSSFSNTLQTKERYPLHQAVASDDLAKLENLLDSGMDINTKTGVGDTPLILASKKGRIDIAKRLVEHGANIHITDNYKQSALYYAVTKYHISHPTNRQEGHSDLAAILIEKGAKNTPIRKDPEFFLKAVKALSVRHRKMAESYVKREFHKEMSKTEPDYIKKHVQDFLQNPNPNAGLKDTLNELININVHYNNKLEAVTHLAHLNSWTGKVFDAEHELDAEGWLMSKYPPLKVRNLLKSLRDINDDNLKNSNGKKVSAEELFNEPKGKVIKKLVSEIESQLTTYYTQVNQGIIKSLENPRMKVIALNEEVKMVCKKISTLSPGKEFAIASGYPGHAIYIGFKKDNDGSITRRVYNLGGGIAVKEEIHKDANKDKKNKEYKIRYNHVFSNRGKVYPNVIEKIPVSIFQSEKGGGAQYVKGVLKSKLGTPNDYHYNIYDKDNHLGGIRITKDFKEPAQKRQLAGNCVLKNNNAALRNRLDNVKLFKWLKNEEISVAKEIAQIGNYSSKEREKDILSVEYIVREYRRSKNPKGAVENFNSFFGKRLPLTNKNHLSPSDKLADFVKTNKNNPDFRKWSEIPSVSNLLNTLSTKMHKSPEMQM